MGSYGLRMGFLEDSYGFYGSYWFPMSSVVGMSCRALSLLSGPFFLDLLLADFREHLGFPRVALGFLWG